MPFDETQLNLGITSEETIEESAEPTIEEPVEDEAALLERLGITEDQAASTVRNHEGEPAFLRGAKERTIQVMTTNTLDGTFYASKSEVREGTVEALESMMQADPEFLAKAAVYARNNGLLQLAPILGLAVLSKAEDKKWFKAAFPHIICTPDNLRDFVSVCKSGEIRTGLGGVAYEAVKEWLSTISEFHAIKYSGNTRSERKNGTVVNKFSLKDMVTLARPKPENEDMDERFRWITRGAAKGAEIVHNPRIKAYEALKKAETDEERCALIKEGGLPWEVVIPSVPHMSPELWEALMTQMPYMALLRNINNLSKNGVLKSEDNVEYLVGRLTDAEAIKKAKILPFRLYEAYVAYENMYGEDSRIADALEEALEASFVNMPDLPGEVAIGSDVSGSMGGTISEKGVTRYIDICGVFTGALLKKASGRVHALPFNYDVVKVDVSGQDRILTTANKIVQKCGGGTALGAPIENLMKRGQSVDTFIGITDNEDWAYGSGRAVNGSFLNSWRKYRASVNPNAQAYLVRIDPYAESVAPQGEPGVHFIYGWSDNVPAYIARDAAGKKNQVEEVEAVQL